MIPFGNGRCTGGAGEPKNSAQVSTKSRGRKPEGKARRGGGPEMQFLGSESESCLSLNTCFFLAVFSPFSSVIMEDGGKSPFGFYCLLLAFRKTTRRWTRFSCFQFCSIVDGKYHAHTIP